MNSKQTEPTCNLSNAELIDRVEKWVHKLAETGGQAWTLRVPVDFNHDPDMLIIELCKRFSASLPSKPVGDVEEMATVYANDSEWGYPVDETGEFMFNVIVDAFKSGYAAAPQKGMRESIITDEQIEQAWGYANFGSTPKRKVISESLKKVAQGYHNGSTATAITKELGLIEGREKNRYYVLTDLGLKYLLADESPSPSEAGDEIEIIDGYTQLAIDKRSLPKDGQHVKFMTENEEFHEGYFVGGDDIFHVTDSKFFFKWHVQQWKVI